MTKLTKAQAKEKLRRLVNPLGWVFRWLGVIRFYDDGDGVSCIWRWWHPLTWVWFVAMVPVCAFIGERVTEVVPFRVSKWFRDHPERLQWL